MNSAMGNNRIDFYPNRVKMQRTYNQAWIPLDFFKYPSIKIDRISENFKYVILNLCYINEIYAQVILQYR